MDVNQYYQECGSGDPILFIHGSYATDSTWKPIVAQLKDRHHCICIKLPGHGGVPEPDDFDLPSIETDLAIIEQVAAKVTNQPIHLVGHSYGGVVAQSLAFKRSIKIRRLTLFEPVACWVLEAVDDHEMFDLVKTFISKYRHNSARNEGQACRYVIDFWSGEGTFDALPNFIKEAMQPLVKNNLRHWDIMDTYPYGSNDLHSQQAPTQVVCGDQSNPVAHAIVNHLNTHINRCEKHIIKGASHFLVNSHPGECAKILLA
ncbi:MAG: alpha/beta hydrolase [Acidiferrobacterales bacterium]|nr:alpha/beta hydrolase [Acidiferrobacterales bacterium]